MVRLQTGGLVREYPDIADPFFVRIFPMIQPYTLTASDLESPWATYQAVQYVVKNKIPGDIVECGVWRGGTMLLIAMTLVHLGDTSRKLYLYDTFAGMPAPEEIDKFRFTGEPALLAWERHQERGIRWGYGGSVDDVRRLMQFSLYPEDNLVFVEGMVEETLPGNMPETVSLLRLDTDLHRSTYHELSHLYPILSPGGILIIDDYGEFEGAHEATDRYVAENELVWFLGRINESARLVVKPGPVLKPQPVGRDEVTVSLPVLSTT